MPTPHKDDLILYHLCESTKINYMLQNWKCKKIAIYHNTTPPHFFAPFSRDAAKKQRESLHEISMLTAAFHHVIADSDFNRNELIRLGFSPDIISTIPILIAFDDYKRVPDSNIINKYNDGKTNILFVGRICPNKKQEDVIRAYAWYKNYINANSRLILIGSPFSQEYMDSLCEYVKLLDVRDVIFPGHISFSKILAFYKTASIFLCMSEHEGFGVPLVEAMLFDVPILAYSSTAIPWTLGGSGVLFEKKDPVLVGNLMQQVVSDNEYRKNIIQKQRERLNDFDPKAILPQILNVIEEIKEL